MDKFELKSIALTDKIGKLVSAYENELAEIRADATMQIAQLKQENEGLKHALAEATKNFEPDTE